MSEREDREAFEAYCLAHGMAVDKVAATAASVLRGQYRAVYTRVAWTAWQAALRYEREDRGRDEI